MTDHLLPPFRSYLDADMDLLPLWRVVFELDLDDRTLALVGAAVKYAWLSGRQCRDEETAGELRRIRVEAKT